MDYKIISLDVDGTLLTDQGILPNENRSALLAAKANGVHIILNTGKPADSLSTLFDQLDLHEPAITLTGGLIVQRDENDHWQVIKDYPISLSALQSLAELFQGTSLTLFVLLADRSLIHFDRHDPVTQQYLSTLLANTSFPQCEEFDRSPLLEAQVLTQPVYKVMLNTHDQQTINVMYERMRRANISGIEFKMSAKGTIDIHSDKTGKLNALQYVAGMMNVSASQVMAMGDNETDLDVIRWAGYGAIMANGPESVRLQAPHIAPGNQDCGVAHVVNRYLLKGMH